MTLKLDATWNYDPLPASDQQSVAYALIDAKLDTTANETPDAAQVSLSSGSAPLNLSLVLDTSGSMGGAKLQNLKDAVKWVINHLGPEDTIAITLFDEEVKPLSPSVKLASAQGLVEKVDAVREAGGTAMSKGLMVGLDEAMRGSAPGSVSRIILLTDGQTWGDADQCKEFARQAGAAGIPITALGVGAEEDWSIELLDDIATESGGLSGYIAKPEEIADAFKDTVQAMQETTARNVRVSLQPSSGVSVRTLYRVAPIISKLWPPEGGAVGAEGQQGAIPLPLGDMQPGTPQTLLVELLVPPRRPGQYRLARLLLNYESTNQPDKELSAALDLAVDFSASVRRGPGNPRVMNSVEKATAFKLQTRALQASMVGDVANATRNLRAAATRLLNMGETDLADAAENEAKLLESKGQMSPAGTKKLAFETRKLAVVEADTSMANASQNQQP